MAFCRLSFFSKSLPLPLKKVNFLIYCAILMKFETQHFHMFKDDKCMFLLVIRRARGGSCSCPWLGWWPSPPTQSWWRTTSRPCLLWTSIGAAARQRASSPTLPSRGEWALNSKDFSFQIKWVSFPLLDNYSRPFRTFGPHQYCANAK